MLRIGDFSKLSMLTVSALRFYEREGLLMPASIDAWTGYRSYETSQLETAAKIKSYRQLGLSIEEIKDILEGGDIEHILNARAEALRQEQEKINETLSIIEYILEENEMKYHVTEKVIPETTVYYSEAVLDRYADMMTWIPSLGAECKRLNPEMKCAEPAYEFCEYLDLEYKEENIKVRHNEAVTSAGTENDIIKFREIPEVKVLSIYHKGSYSRLNEAYAFIMKYAEENGYECVDYIRESYIDGIWNKEREEDWLTEIQLPIEKRG